MFAFHVVQQKLCYIESHTTLVGFAAGVVHGVEFEAQRARLRSGTQVYVALCGGQKDGMRMIKFTTS